MAHCCTTVDEDLKERERVKPYNSLHKTSNIKARLQSIQFPAEEPVKLDLQM